MEGATPVWLCAFPGWVSRLVSTPVLVVTVWHRWREIATGCLSQTQLTHVVRDKPRIPAGHQHPAYLPTFREPHCNDRRVGGLFARSTSANASPELVAFLHSARRCHTAACLPSLALSEQSILREADGPACACSGPLQFPAASVAAQSCQHQDAVDTGNKADIRTTLAVTAETRSSQHRNGDLHATRLDPA